MPSLKPFQLATVEAVVAAFSQPTGSRRFLVADEVGLGKTVVARSVVERLSEGRRRPLIVFYVTNGQRVANQNRSRLVDFLDKEARSAALARADRLGLVPMTPCPKGRVALYALTPATSFPGQTARLHAGRKEERAFLQALAEVAIPEIVSCLPDQILQGAARSGWEELIDYHRARAPELKALAPSFRKALAAEFSGSGQRVRDAVIDAAGRLSPGRFIGRLRRALAHAALLARPPDLVIFDEFQRYRDLLSQKGLEDRLTHTLLTGNGERRPAVLLLSATPYKLYASRWEESRGAEAHKELFDLLEFLGGDKGPQLRQDAATAFGEFGARLRAIVTSQTADERKLFVSQAAALRAYLQALLAPVMSRTEREGFVTTDSAHTIPLNASLSTADIRAYRHLVSSFRATDQSDALPYWLSVPLPAQALGPRYKAWKLAKIGRDGRLVKLTAAARNRFELPSDWPHPKYRALRKVMRPEVLSLPWVAPSRPWWDPAGPWANADANAKLLLFSRFKATPQSIAALTSLEVEAAYLRGTKGGYEQAWSKRRLQAGPNRLPTLALFHPSPWLIEAVDPYEGFGLPVRAVRAIVRRQLMAALKRDHVKVVKATAKDRRRHRPTWQIIAALECGKGLTAQTARAWRDVANGDRQLRDLIDEWHCSASLDGISPREVEDLVTYALASPGVVLGRALRRHDPSILNDRHYVSLVRLSWHGLRTYLDNPVFWSRLKGRTPAEALHRAAVEGNLEAVLDEHFWIRRQALSEGNGALAADLLDTLGLSTGSFLFHGVGVPGTRVRVRCHVAVPFGGTDAEESTTSPSGEGRPPRSDEIRKAFNTPFWPHVLTTTSVGQEGLDFHTWCSRVVHWDLCSNPLDLEQREGRIQRFGGLAVRRRLAVAGNMGAHPVSASCTSPWDAVAAHAEATLSDDTGLSPWWVLRGAGVTRYVFDLPRSRDTQRFMRLKEQRLVYRLALGQPNQEDLIEILARGGPEAQGLLRPLALDLSAIGRTRRSDCELAPIGAVEAWVA